MPNKPGKIDWQKRLALMKQGHADEPPQPGFSALEVVLEEVSGQQPEPDPKLDRQRDPHPGPKPLPEPKTGLESESGEAQEIKATEASQEPDLSLPNPREEHLDSLERQIRSLKIWKNMALSLTILLLLSFAITLTKTSGGNGRISAANLTINDAKGISRVWVGEHDGQVGVELRDPAGRRRLSLAIDATGAPRLIFYDKDQKILTEVLPPDKQSELTPMNQSTASLLTIPAPSPAVPAVPEPQAVASMPTPIPQPEKVSPEVPQVEEKSENQPETSVKAGEESEIFLGSPRGKTYHFPSCPWIKNIPLEKLVKFSTAAEAAEAGYYPCRRCRPGRKD